MRNDEPRMWVVSKIASPPIMVSRVRHSAVGKTRKEIAGWGFGSLSGYPGLQNLTFVFASFSTSQNCNTVNSQEGRCLRQKGQDAFR